MAGLAGSWGSTDGTGSGARFSDPYGVAVDAAGHLYVADSNSRTIRRITQFGSLASVTTVAGLAGNRGSEDGTGSAARFDMRELDRETGPEEQQKIARHRGSTIPPHAPRFSFTFHASRLYCGMDKDQVAGILKEIGTLLELKGENPFKTRAYSNAARTLEGLTEPLGTLVAEGRLGEIKNHLKALRFRNLNIPETG